MNLGIKMMTFQYLEQFKRNVLNWSLDTQVKKYTFSKSFFKVEPRTSQSWAYVVDPLTTSTVFFFEKGWFELSSLEPRNQIAYNAAAAMWLERDYAQLRLQLRWLAEASKCIICEFFIPFNQQRKL